MQNVWIEVMDRIKLVGRLIHDKHSTGGWLRGLWLVSIYSDWSRRRNKIEVWTGILGILILGVLEARTKLVTRALDITRASVGVVCESAIS